MSYREYILRLKAYEKKKTEDWERTRWMAFVAARVAGSKINSPKDLLRLPSDGEERKVEAVVITEEDIQALINIGLIK